MSLPDLIAEMYPDSDVLNGRELVVVELTPLQKLYEEAEEHLSRGVMPPNGLKGLTDNMPLYLKGYRLKQKLLKAQKTAI